MSVTIDIPDQLVELLRTLATARGISVEELGQRALAVGLNTLAGDSAADIIDIGAPHAERLTPGTTISMRSPIMTTGLARLRPITIEPTTEANADAN